MMDARKGLGMGLLLILLTFLTVPLFAQSIFYGDSASLGQGIIRSWVEVTADSVPVNIGATLTAAALEGLPSNGNNISLNLPPVTRDTLFKHIYFDWNPQGHPPVPYQVPHFDIHFYTITAAQREAIPGGTDNVAVAPQFLPPNYSAGPLPYQVVPQMGVHFVDTTAPEFHGQPFRHTMIYGFYHGQFIFYEPMITLAYLQMNPDSTFPIPQPESYQHSGYYPTTYTVLYDAANYLYTISIGNFEFRNVAGSAVDPLQAAQPSSYALLDNYPNPFNPSTTIQFVLPRASHVTLTIYNLLGEEVASLVKGEMSEGLHTVQFDGSRLASGVYLYRLQTAGFTSAKRMLLLK